MKCFHYLPVFPYETNHFQLYGNDQEFQIVITDIFNHANPCNEVTYINFDFDKDKNLFIAENSNIAEYVLKLLVERDMIIIKETEICLNPIFLLKLL